MQNSLLKEKGMAASDRQDGRMSPLTAEQIDALRRFDTCTIANAIEEFKIRLRNEGYTRPGLRCINGSFPPAIGYAATCRVKSADPPVTGAYYFHRTDWWTAIESLPAPRIAVIEDLDPHPSAGACVGEVHAAMLKAFRCTGVITNGAVRNLPAVTAMGFPMFARSAAVSHAYMHMVDFGHEVEIFGLKIRPGDLLLADGHGVISIPLEIAAELPAVAARVHAERQRIVEVCLSPDFSTAKLQKAIDGDRD
jgi:4-hydroxy-4-methyl-2-oxoglutarate aldolase